MEKPTKIEFNVDEQYENEKGIFTVISIHRDQMVIRWESGEEIRTDIALQTRIAERRQWEKLNREAQAQAAKASRKSGSRKKGAFTGFAPTDFKKSASRTTWRSRSQLGEAITQKIDTVRLKLNSWAFGHKPEMHIQDAKHRSSAAPDDQARFFIRVDQRALYYGFRVARPAGSDDASSDWGAFCEWLAEPENEQTIHKIASEYQLAVSNFKKPASSPLLTADDGWLIDKTGKESLIAYINDAPKSGPFDLEISASMDKAEAVGYGIDISTKIAQLFSRLLPVYQAAVIH
jgi:hypothetical protein